MSFDLDGDDDIVADPPEGVFAPVRSQTAFEETFERLGTAIKLGLLEPGSRLPAERELCGMLAVSRSTLRQALRALTQAGYVHALRGRSGGTFVVDELPPADPPGAGLLESWRELSDIRLATELGVAALAAERGRRADLGPLEQMVEQMDDDDLPWGDFRQLDARFHIGLAELTGSRRLVVASTEAQAALADIVAFIPHPPEVLGHSNHQHRLLLDMIAHGRRDAALATMAEHVLGTVHVLGGTLPGQQS